MAEISRRAVVALLGAGAVAAGAQYGLKAAGSPVGPSEAEPGDDNPIRAENRRAGSRDWKIGSGSTVAADDLGRQIKGYASAASVNLGESIDFHVSTHPARPYTVTVYRMGDDDEMARIAAMDTGTTLFFDHRDPAMVSAIGNRPIHD